VETSSPLSFVSLIFEFLCSCCSSCSSGKMNQKVGGALRSIGRTHSFRSTRSRSSSLRTFTYRFHNGHRFSITFRASHPIILFPTGKVVLHMSHISHGPPTQDGRTKPRMSKESRLHPQNGEYSPHRCQITPDMISRGAVHHFLCTEIWTTLLVERTRFMHHQQMNTCRHLNSTSGLLLMITLPYPCISLTCSRDNRR